MPESVDAQKGALRRGIRSARGAMLPADRAAAEERIGTRLWDLWTAHGAGTVACYLPTATEPSPRTFVDQVLDDGVRVLAPVARTDGTLDWTPIAPGWTARRGPLGVPEPVGDALGPGALAEAAFVVVPAAAIDHDGMRLGWGRGYYDRALAAVPLTGPAIAVVFDPEFGVPVPRGPHDLEVDGVVTPDRSILFDEPGQARRS